MEEYFCLEKSLHEYFEFHKKEGFSKGEQIGAMTLSISRILDEVYKEEKK